VLIGYAEALGGAKAAARPGDGGIDPNQELVAHGPANILTGLFGGFLVVGSLSKTSVAMAAGARTQVANLVAALLCFLSLVLLTPLFRGMPHPTLGAIVIAAMLHLSKPGYLGDVLARSRWEFTIAVIVLAGELTLGVLQGIALGVVLSLVLLIHRTSHPHDAVLGQLPGKVYHLDVYATADEKQYRIREIFHSHDAMRLLGMHPNLVRCGDMFTWNDDSFVEPVGYLEGGQLLEWLLDKRSEQALTWDEKTRIIKGVAVGLAHAHKHGVIHRDVRPRNIIIAPGGVVKLGNFDLAFTHVQQASAPLRSRRGTVK
jgi:hypothetical protein